MCAVQASLVYLSLLQLPGCGAFKIFHPMVFQKALDVFYLFPDGGEWSIFDTPAMCSWGGRCVYNSGAVLCSLFVPTHTPFVHVQSNYWYTNCWYVDGVAKSCSASNLVEYYMHPQCELEVTPVTNALPCQPVPSCSELQCQNL